VSESFPFWHKLYVSISIKVKNLFSPQTKKNVEKQTAGELELGFGFFHPSSAKDERNLLK